MKKLNLKELKQKVDLADSLDEKYEILNTAAQRAQRDPDRCLMICDLLEAFGKEHEYSPAMVGSFYWKSIMFLFKGQHENSLELLENALEIALRENLRHQEANIYLVLANVYQGLDSAGETFKHVLMAKKLLKELEVSPAKIGRTYAHLGAFYSWVNDYENELKSYETALTYIAQDENVPPLQIPETYNSMSIALKELRRFDEAIDYSQRALATAEKLDATVLIACIYSTQGEILIAQNLFEQSIEMAEKGIGMARKLSLKPLELHSAIVLGEAYFEIGEKEKALAYLRDAEALAMVLKTIDPLAKIKHLIHQIMSTSN